MAAHAFLDASPLAIAHRGGDEVAPENTMRAFEAATAIGFRHLETDVHVTADGGLVAFHDDVLDRVTDATGPIRNLTMAELGDVRIGGTDPIPTLDELLESFPDAFWNIDPKSDGALVALAAVLRRHGAVDRVNVGAFSGERLRRIRALLGPSLCTAGAPAEIVALMGASRLPGRRRRSARVPYACVQVPLAHLRVPILTRRLIEAAHSRGVQVHAWTIDDPAEMERLLDLGVDGIITDRPSLLRDVMVSRGVWH